MELTTERLLLKQLEFGGGNEKNDFMRELASELSSTASSARDDLKWFKLWSINLKADDAQIGRALFCAPNSEGDVEIQYFFEKDFKNLGYDTEAVNALVNWALSQSGVRAVIAETDDDDDLLLKSIGMAELPEDEIV